MTPFSIFFEAASLSFFVDNMPRKLFLVFDFVDDTLAVVALGCRSLGGRNCDVVVDVEALALMYAGGVGTGGISFADDVASAMAEMLIWEVSGGEPVSVSSRFVLGALVLGALEGCRDWSGIMLSGCAFIEIDGPPVTESVLNVVSGAVTESLTDESPILSNVATV